MDLLLTGKTFSRGGGARVGPGRRGLRPTTHGCRPTPSASRAAPLWRLRNIKRCVHEGGQLPLNDGLALEAELVEQLFRSQDANEGLTAFVEKRTPTFIGA